MSIERGSASLGASFSESGTGTRAIPSLSTEGIDLTGIVGFRVILSADLGQNLLGAGKLDFWLYSPSLKRWAQNFQLQTPVTPSGVVWVNRRDIVLSDFETFVRGGRLVVAPNGVTVDGGQVTTTIETIQL